MPTNTRPSRASFREWMHRKSVRGIRSVLLLGFSLYLAANASSALALDLMITSSADPVEDGTALTFTMTVANRSSSAVSNVVLEAVMPDYMSVY